MKKIGIDARLLGQTGVGRYIVNLLHNLPDSPQFSFFIYTLKNNPSAIALSNKNCIVREADYRWHTLSEQTLFLKKLYEDQLDLMHFTYFSYPLFYRKSFIVTLHDIIPYLYKTGTASVGNRWMYGIKHLFYTVLLKNTVLHAAAIITPTQTIKKEIGAAFGAKHLKKIYPIYEGVDSNLMKADENKKLALDFSFPFYIYVGNFYPHKNVENLVKAFAYIAGPTKLILLGPSDFFSVRVRQLIEKLQCQQKILLFPNPSDRDLVFFYAHAKALIHPSLSEGFGLPLLEAAYFNCPVIASDIPVFNEILAGQFIKFNPHDYTDIQNKITKHIVHPTAFQYEKVIQRFSFKKMAQETFSIYQKWS